MWTTNIFRLQIVGVERAEIFMNISGEMVAFIRWDFPLILNSF